MTEVAATGTVIHDGLHVDVLDLDAVVESANHPVVGAAVPTGTVIFEMVQGKRTKVIGTAELSGGKATVSAKIPASLVNQPIEVVYSGDHNFLASTDKTRIG